MHITASRASELTRGTRELSRPTSLAPNELRYSRKRVVPKGTGRRSTAMERIRSRTDDTCEHPVTSFSSAKCSGLELKTQYIEVCSYIMSSTGARGPPSTAPMVPQPPPVLGPSARCLWGRKVLGSQHLTAVDITFDSCHKPLIC